MKYIAIRFYVRDSVPHYWRFAWFSFRMRFCSPVRIWERIIKFSEDELLTLRFLNENRDIIRKYGGERTERLVRHAINNKLEIVDKARRILRNVGQKDADTYWF